MKIAWAGVLIVLCSACGGDEGTFAQASAVQNDEETESIRGEVGDLVLWSYKRSESGLAITIYSGGCTKKEHIETFVYESLPPKVKFVRKVADACDAPKPEGIRLFYTNEELGVRAEHGLKILNRVDAPRK